ncbi:hydroxylamine oxidation protein HaoB [Methylococcus geothermalis]|uniref:Hydroxylamine oxidation protein HaoB n=1 Tax=Methylococcus geothermalis TaxID=2681310 RepID=A0A858Q822_9GAMM|nr:hydroxylamine oxidation protein HaoB [Methylococcus geothermalis]QJD29999.1 hydroxylamine oxidation protein HaoB [Methylococcus geothermalis]
MADTAGQPKRSRLATSTGLALLLAGGATLLYDRLLPQVHYDEAPIPSADWSAMESRGAFPVTALTRYILHQGDQVSVPLTVADYRDGRNQDQRVTLYPPEAGNTAARLRHDLWRAAGEAIVRHTDDNALFLAWWDDAQRIRFLSGRDTWLDRPAAAAFPNGAERSLWEKVAGGFAAVPDPSRRLARWLGMDADTALAEMKAQLPADRPVYMLVCLDDLARLGEIEALAGVRLPFEAARFPGGDMHGQIAAVQQWARQDVDQASYLVQQISGAGVRAWRITTPQGRDTLLARLLPFSTSLARPLPQAQAVYQSGWGSYLTIYALNFGEGKM